LAANIFRATNATTVPTFVDTNILLYAHDAGAGDKRRRAADLLRQLVQSGRGVVSSQVLMEFFVNAMRKPSPPLASSDAMRVVEIYAPWVVAPTSAETVLSALQLRERYKLSPWDALIVAAAIEARCERLFTEDLQHGQRIEGVEIVNPFIDALSPILK
jgi:predicted nucleic acid-binding protein